MKGGDANIILLENIERTPMNEKEKLKKALYNVFTSQDSVDVLNGDTLLDHITGEDGAMSVNEIEDYLFDTFSYYFK